MTSDSDEWRWAMLIENWKAYRASIPEPDRYEQLRMDLYQVRNPDWNGNPPVTAWPPKLIDPDDSIMAAVEHYFLCRNWVGSGKLPAWELEKLNMVYDAGKVLGVTPRHNPNKPTSALTALQVQAKALGIRDGRLDLERSGKKAPFIAKPPTY